MIWRHAAALAQRQFGGRRFAPVSRAARAMTRRPIQAWPLKGRTLAFAPLLIGCFIPTPGISETEACSRRSLLEVAEERSPGVRRRILEAAGRSPNAGAVFFRIDGNDRPPSYIYGTVHVSDERLQVLPPAVDEALRTAKVVILERGDVPEQAVRSVMPLAARLMIMPRNQALDSLISEDEMKVVTDAVKAAGLAPEFARILRPWAATLFLAGSLCERRRFEAGLRPLDFRIMDTARDSGIRIVGLEKIVEQYESLAEIPDDVQVAWLRSSIKLFENIDDMSETTVALYLERKIEAIWYLTVALTEDVGMTDDMMRRMRRSLVDKRNRRMMERAREFLASGGAFVAVGATHLSGTDGLVEQIEMSGLTVTPIF